MTEAKYYKVADHLFGVEAHNNILAQMSNYEPFTTNPADTTDALFFLSVDQDGPVSYIEEWRQDEEGQDTICGHTEQGESVFEFSWGGRVAGWLVYADSKPRLHLTMHS